MSEEITNAELRTLIKQNAEAIKANGKAIKETAEAIAANAKLVAANAEKLNAVAEQVGANAELITEVKASIDALPEVLAVRNSRSFQDHEERIEQLEIEAGLVEPATS